jgi:transketolase
MTTTDQKFVDTIRTLSADQVQAANSGHPGLPLGAAPLAYALWDRALAYNPADLAWLNRDRFVLSAGHGSALIYSLLHLYGCGLTLDDLSKFRQYGAKTPGHPEYGHTPGVETTTGPLGQGICNAVGFAIAERFLAAKFNQPGMDIVDHFTYAIVGDGCLMEGISGEASSLAGTLRLGKLIVLYDSNDISIEGSTSIAFGEDVLRRYDAYGWHTQRVEDGTDVDAIAAAIEAAKREDRPSFIQVRTQIGYGSPRQGKASAHGEPLGKDDLAALKVNLGFDPNADFVVPDEVYAHAKEMMDKNAKAQAAWEALVNEYEKAHPELYAQWMAWQGGKLPDLANDEAFWAFSGKAATRNSSGEALARLAERMPNLIGGSADLAPSNKSYIKGRGDFSYEEPSGANLHFGVREHAMAAICNGIALHGGLRAYCATFFVFSDYMKHAMRLAAIMELPVLYLLTHDSIGVGEDGPTHQPIEQLAMLRSVPGLATFRPADSKEVAAAYAVAVQRKGPTALALTRQDLPLYENSGREAMRGAYILSDAKKEVPDVLLMASGSEVELCMLAQEALRKEGIDARVVSMPCWEIFDAQPKDYRDAVLPPAVRARVGVEAASSFGWHKYTGLDGALVTIDHYGASGPAKTLFKEFGFTVEAVMEAAKRVMGASRRGGRGGVRVPPARRVRRAASPLKRA